MFNVKAGMLRLRCRLFPNLCTKFQSPILHVHVPVNKDLVANKFDLKRNSDIFSSCSSLFNLLGHENSNNYKFVISIS